MRRSGRKWLSLLLALCMVVTMLPAMSVPAAAADQTFNNGQTIDTQTINSNTTWNIPQGVTVSVQGQITISSNATLTLTGGGTIQRAAEYKAGPLFAVGGTLEATDVVMDGQNIMANNAAIFTQNTGSIINLSNVTLKNFTSSIYRGGALRMDNGGAATLTNCTIQNNSATSYGGAICARNDSTLSISESTFKGNKTTSDTSTYGGGALYIRDADVSLDNVIFSQNTSTRGGAIYNSSYGTLTITGGSISGNTAIKSGYENSAGIFHSSQEANGSVLNLKNNVQISDPIYLDGTESEKVVVLQSALQHPLTLYCANATEGRVVIQGDTNYTVTAQDMARLSMKNDGWYFGLSAEGNQIFITKKVTEAYIPITIKSDDNSLNVELKQNGQTVALDYSETAEGYIGSVPAGTYDVYVGGADTGNDITVSVNDTIFGPEVLMHHSHPICGDSSCQEHGGAVSFYPLTSLSSTLAQGNYYLTSSLTNNTGNDITINGAVNLCLNGKTLNLNGRHIIVPTGASLTLCDCGTTGEITGGIGEHGGAIYVNGGTLTLYSGTITGNTANGNGGGVYVLKGTFTMHGGTIDSNTANQGGGVLVEGSTFTMTGGSISDNTATQAESGGGGIFVTGASSSFTMSGSSSISNNMASGSASRGGGIYLPSGTFTMSDNASITGNTATNGGGVFTNSKFTLAEYATITDNKADKNGGGVFVNSNGSFSISGAPTVTNNTRSSDNAGNNVLLLKDKTIGITNPLTSGKIGVTMETLGVFTSGWGNRMDNADPNEYFTSDSGTYLVMLNNDSSEVMLHTHSYTYTANGGSTITERCACGHEATATISVPADADLTYTGSAITPAQVTYSTGWLGGNLTINYSDNTNAGTATATIKKGDGEASVTFTIAAKAYSDGAGFTIDPIADQTYTGKQITPDVTVKFGSTTLAKDTDYDLSYGDNTDVGTNAGSVTITFKGNYSGTAEKTFNIVYATLTGGTTNDTVFDDYGTTSDWSNSDSVTFETQGGWTVSTTPDGTYSGSVPFNDKEDGEYTKTVYVKDSNGNIFKTEITYKLDKTHPTVSEPSPSVESGTWTSGGVTVSFNAKDTMSDIKTVTVKKPDDTTETLTGSGGDYSFTATENGTYTVTVTDNAGNTTTKEINISNIDKTPPTLSVTGGDMGAASLTLETQATQNGGSPVTVAAKDSSGHLLTANADGSYTITKPGDYTFTATTGAGVTTTVTKTVHSVTFDSDSGSEVARQLVVSGGKVTQPANPTRTGYAFDCWQSGSADWNFESGTVTSNLTLTARWTLNKPTVSITGNTTGIYNGGNPVVTLTAEASHTASGPISYTYTWYKTGNDTPIKTGNGDVFKTLALTDVDDSGEYKVVVTATDSDGLTADREATVAVAIAKATVAVPAEDTTVFTYNGQAQTYTIAANDLYTIAGNTQTTVGTYTVTVSLKDADNYTWAGGSTADLEYTFAIAPKAITGTWQGLNQVYGSSETVRIHPDGMEAGDDSAPITYHYTGTTADGRPYNSDVPPTDAGTYTVTATIDNYTITNGTATLVIQQKPVVITVTDNAAAAGDTPAEPTVNVPAGWVKDEDYTVTYKDKDGNAADLTQPGTYEVWVEFTDPNYRHSDGSSAKPVGSFTVTDGTPTLYTASFDGNGHTSGTMADLSAAGGSTLTLPACSYTKSGSSFTGWLYVGKVYQPGDSVTMPAQDVTFTAQWQQTQYVAITVKDEADAGVENAVVSIWQGANQLKEDTTDSDGGYTFEKLAPGSYNVSVSVGDKTVTTAVTVDEAGAVTGGDITLPEQNLSSRVEVTPGSPDVVVGGMESVFTEEDKTTGVSSKVEYTFTAEKKQEDQVSEDLEKISAVSGGSSLSLVMDYAIVKTVTTGGTIVSTANVPVAGTLLEVRLPLPTALQGKYAYQLYRVHQGEAQSVPQGEGSKNTDGEYFTVSEDKTTLILHVKKFSTYAVSYTEQPSSGGAATYPPTQQESENGSFTLSPSRPSRGDTVTITPRPDVGYVAGSVTVTDKNGNAVAVTPNADGTYTFTQPGSSVTVAVTFRKDTGVADCPRNESCPMAPFTDTDRSAWYHDGVHYCVAQGLMVGTSETTFAPDIPITRGMIVTILWRLEGSPIVRDPMDYDDVKPEDWYGEAVHWANSAGVVTGYGNGKFGPNDPITREQMAAMLWRYAGSPAVEGAFSVFVDGTQTSGWAQSAMIWAVDQGLIAGVGNDRLEPGGKATRAQAATILMRFAENMAQ